MSLLKKLQQAVNNKEIVSPFSTQDLKNWIKKYKITNDKTGQEYEDSYIEGFLSSSEVNSSSTKGDKGVHLVSKDPNKYEF